MYVKLDVRNLVIPYDDCRKIIFLYSVRMLENTNQKNSEYGLFLPSE